MARIKQRTPELRDRILTASMELLAHSGVSGITTRGVAERADTSLPAVYELFGDKAGLVRAIFFTGFEQLGAHLRILDETDEPLVDLRDGALAFRSFAQQNSTLFEVMFFRPFATFEPGPSELAAGASVREFVVNRIDRCSQAGLIAGDPTDTAHALLGLLLGLARQEAGGWLGHSEESMERRWALGVDTFIAGLAQTESTPAI